MSLSDEHAALADALYDARGSGRTVARPAPGTPGLGLDAGYSVARRLDARLQADGWQRIGRKIAFTNRDIWPEYNVDTPLWAPLYDRSVIDAPDGRASLSLAGTVAPKIEPEVVLGLRRAVAAPVPGADSLIEAIEWAAIGFEIVDCHFPDWRFSAGEAAADYGLHGALVVGPRVEIDHGRPEETAEALRTLRVELRRQGHDEVLAGTGRNALGGPLDALAFLLTVLERQPWAPPLEAGEIVTTGTLLPPPPVRRGDVCTVQPSGGFLQPLELRL